MGKISELPVGNTVEDVTSAESLFRSQILEVRDALLGDILPIYKEICGCQEIESQGGNIDSDFTSLIDRLNQKLDIHLPQILPILERHKKEDSTNIGTDFLHIWYGFGRALSGILLCYREQIHDIVDPTTHRVSFGKGFPNKWRALSEQVKGRINRTNNL